MLITALPPIRRRPAAVHALVFALVLCGVLTVLLGQGEAAKAMGRQSDLTGRTEIWNVLIPVVPNWIVGAGFEAFWSGSRVQILDLRFPDINEAHNGYLEVYLNLGLCGLGLILLVLVHGYCNAIAAFRRDPVLGSLLAAYILSAATYNITEAGFRVLHEMWFFLLVSIVAASRVVGSDKRSVAPEVTYQEHHYPEFAPRLH